MSKESKHKDQDTRKHRKHNHERHDEKNDPKNSKSKNFKRNWSMSPQVSHFEETDNEKHTKRKQQKTFVKVDKEVVWGKAEIKTETPTSPEKPKELPNFEVSGKLAEETNKYKGVIIKYNEPPEARIPKKRWRLYPFKSGESIKPILYLHRQSAFLVGRDRRICEIPVDHPSCSKQHAVLQFRAQYSKETDPSTEPKFLTEEDILNNTNPDRFSLNAKKKTKITIKPYIIDLESANGTFLNNKQLDPKRYYELLESDVLKFGFSTREYVLLHENSTGTLSDENPEEDEALEVEGGGGGNVQSNDQN